MNKLMDEIAKELTPEMITDSIWRHLADEIGAYNVIKMMELLNGDTVYVPKPDRILIYARDKKIKEEFNQNNAEILAKKYCLSTRYIKTLCRGGNHDV